MNPCMIRWQNNKKYEIIYFQHKLEHDNSNKIKDIMIIYLVLPSYYRFYIYRNK